MSFPLRTRTRGRPSRGSKVTAPGHDFDALGLITWDLGAWYAEDPDWTNPGNGGLIDQWDDGGSGTARHMVATTTARPTYSSSVAAFNSKPAVTVDGGDSMAMSGTFTTPSIPYSVVLIGKFGSLGTSQGLWGRGTTGAGLGHIFLNGPDNTYRAYMGNGANVITSTVPGDTNVHLFRAYMQNETNAGRFEVDGTSTTGTLGTSGSGGLSSLTSFGLFSLSNGANKALSGSGLAFAGVFTGDVSADPGWAQFKADAATHYGLTLA